MRFFMLCVSLLVTAHQFVYALLPGSKYLESTFFQGPACIELSQALTETHLRDFFLRLEHRPAAS